MNNLSRSLFFLTVLAPLAPGQEALQLPSPKDMQQEVRRGKDGPALLTYLITDTHSRPYIHPLRSADGKGILTQFSPGHHKHQTGLYWGPTRINGRDYFHHYDQSYWTDRAGDAIKTQSNC